MMELDNVSFPKLTEAERQTFESNGWCKYCRSKYHAIEKCPIVPKGIPSPQPQFNSRSLNATATSTRTDFDE